MSQVINHSYVSCACNRTPNSVDWGYNNLICYSACNGIIIWDKKGNNSYGNIIQTLCKHQERVNCVRWISRRDIMIETELVSCSTDKTAIVWTRKNDNFYASAVLEGHNGSVSVADGIYVYNGSKDFTIIATSSTDGTVKIWRRYEKNGPFQCTQTLVFPVGNLCISLRFHFLPGTNVPILACGVSDNQIYLFADHDSNISTESDDYKEFKNVEVLTGHKGWIYGLDFMLNDDNNLFLASSSQDSYIRLWKITKIVDVNIDSSSNKEIKIQEKVFAVKNCDNSNVYSLKLESVLSSHESWVYGVHWRPKITIAEMETTNEEEGDGEIQVTERQPMELLSSSMDKSIILWKYDTKSDVWKESVRVGEVGGNTLGFYGGKFGPTGKYFLGHGYQGSFHIWAFIPPLRTWEPDVVVGGHFDEVTDICWDSEGEYLLSVGLDETTRLHAQWIYENEKNKTWHELARPQVHGYSMNSIAILERYKFASGAEEKVIRVFEAPRNFVENFRNICCIKSDPKGDSILKNSTPTPFGASVPSLGLSNQAVFDKDEHSKKSKLNEPTDTTYFTALHLQKPPTEENLIQNTLWPEVQKLYGHGFEIFTLAATPDGKTLASASKGTKLEHAFIIIWETESWQPLQKLLSHTLTITQLAFSPKGDELLSVSRDRRWSLFKKHKASYDLVTTTDKHTAIHTRIIWCCAWTHDCRYFMTGSRDAKVVVWGKVDNKNDDDVKKSLKNYGVIGSALEIENNSITAADFAPVLIEESYLLAVGFHNGLITLYKWNPVLKNCWTKCIVFDQCMAHHLTVKRLKFRPLPVKHEEPLQILQLASAGSDHFIRIYDIVVSML